MRDDVLTRARIRILSEPPDPAWPDAPAHDGTLTYLTWPHPADGGVPAGAARALASALCEAAGVLYLGAEPPAHPSAQWTRASRGSWTCVVRLPFSLWSPVRRRSIDLTYTRSPERACRLFDVPHFNWSTRGQTAWLFPLSDAPPRIDPLELEGALADEGAFRLPFGAAGRLRPGTDGAFAELFVRDPFVQSAIVEALLDRAEP
jgi:hypothetical protein